MRKSGTVGRRCEQMAFLLCHECYSWVEPQDGRCPECVNGFDPATPDPPLHELQMAIGQIISRVGEVKVQRKMLPDRGMLYATSNGLFFLPHEMQHITRMVENNGGGTSLLLLLAGMIWAPLGLLLPFLKTSRLQAAKIKILRPRFLTPDDSHRLAELLMENPGVFFVPKKSILAMRRRRKHWLIERRQSPRLKLKPSANTGRFESRMAELAECRTWESVLFAS